MTRSDRRRVTLATIATALALVGLLVVDNGPNDGPDDALAAGEALVGSPTAPPTTAYEPDAPVFVADDGLTDDLLPANVLVPPPLSGNIVIGRASHARYDDALDNPCTTGVAPDQAVIVITNLNNGQTTSCVNTYGKTPPVGVDIVIDADEFAEIAVLTDAPIPVRLSW